MSLCHRTVPHLEMTSCVSLHKHTSEDARRQSCAETSSVVLHTQLWMPHTIVPYAYYTPLHALQSVTKSVPTMKTLDGCALEGSGG